MRTERRPAGQGRPNLGRMIAAHAATAPASCAIQTRDAAIGFGDLAHHVRRYAAALQAVDPSDRPVAIRLANGVDRVVAELALLEFGRAVVPIAASLPIAEARELLAAAGASSLVDDEGMRILDTPVIPIPPDVAMIAQSSGVTGTPRLVRLTHAEIAATLFSAIARLGIRRDVRHLAILSSSAAPENILGMLATLVAGGTYLPDPDAAGATAPSIRGVIARAARLEATSVLLAPGMLRELTIALETCGRRLPRLRKILVVGGGLSQAWRDRAARVGLDVTEMYWFVEAGGAVAIGAPEDSGSGTAGRALGHVRIGLGIDGEIILHTGDTLGLGVRRATRTGDLGTLDEGGRLIVTGRRSNLLATLSGHSVQAEHIERALLDQAEISEAIVFCDHRGELRAILVARPDGAGVAAAIERANRSLPPPARVSAWEVCAPFAIADGTLTADGRPRRAAIIDRWRQALEAPGAGLVSAELAMMERGR